MQSTDVIAPLAIGSPIAVSGDKNIPSQTASGTDTSSIAAGFLPITSEPLDDGGVAPERIDFNGMFYLSTDQRVYLQNGGRITYSASVATAIGGYPQNAILDYLDSNGNYMLVRSLINNNTYNFITNPEYIDGVHWESIQLGGNSRNIGEIVTSTIPLIDAGLHLLDGSVLSGSGSYADFVNYIADLYSDDSNANYFTTESDWLSSVSTYGVCGKFVYNSTNNTVRLPKVTGFIEGASGTSTLGNLTQAGLPNITGNIGPYQVRAGIDFRKSGAFNSPDTETIHKTNDTSNTGAGNRFIDFDASRSNAIYGNSATVQPQSVKVLYYIVIATSTKTSIEVDIDEIATDLNGKADVDLTNVNASGTSKSAGWTMPSSTYDTLTLGASGSTYTAPANGWVVATQRITSGYLGLATVYTNSDGICMQVNNATSNAQDLNVFIPIQKNETFKVVYGGTLGTATSNRFLFVYAKGSESEAS